MSKSLSATQAYRRTKKGVLTNMYGHMLNRNSVLFTLPEFHKRFMDDDKFKRLHDEWVKSGFLKQMKPSLDRIDCKKPYTVENTQMLTWAENRYKQSKFDGKRGRKPRVIQMLGSKVIKVFQSQRHVVKDLGVSQGNLSNVLTGKRNTVDGYSFVYESPELLEQ